jgi:hypothetical protein
LKVVGDFFLQDAEILPPSPPADEVYLGKEIEISGHVAAVLPAGNNLEYPTLKLERNTDGLVDNHCLFPKSDEAELKKLTPGAFVTISATCSGRGLRGKEYYVRFDNCRLIYTTAPTSPEVHRLLVTQVLKDYEEDLRTALPVSDLDPNPKTLLATQLAKEFKQDSKAFEKNYRNKIIVVAGKLSGKGDRIVTLDTGLTDNPLKIECRFTRQAFQQLGDRQDLTIRGLCNGVTAAQTLRLDNCESLDPAAKVELVRLTADFLPSKPGLTLVYDQASLPVESKGPPLAFRKVCIWLERGIMERTITHAGRLQRNVNLSEADAFKDWMTLKTTTKYSQAEPPLHYRIYGGFIEIGTESIGLEGQKNVAFEPAIKLGANKGETWEWSRGTIRHVCKLVDFKQVDGISRQALAQMAPTPRDTATIRESITDLKRPAAYTEIRHVYAKDMGEVEREEATRLPSGQMKIISLMRLAAQGDQERKMKAEKGEGKVQKAEIRGQK